MKTDREFLDQALSALKAFDGTIPGNTVMVGKAIEAIEKRLAEPEPDPVRLSDDEILALAEKYGTSETRLEPTYHLHDGSPTGEVYPQVGWLIGQEDLLGFARELLEKNQ